MWLLVGVGHLRLTDCGFALYSVNRSESIDDPRTNRFSQLLAVGIFEAGRGNWLEQMYIELTGTH